MLLSSLLAAQLAFAAGCGSEVTPVSPEDADAGPQAAPSVQPSIRDGAHDGREGFYFLPPLVEEPSFEGTFDPDRAPTVEICELTDTGCEPVIATFTMDTGPGSETVRVDGDAEQYVVDWHTDEFELVEGATYRIRVLLDGREAGHADVVAVTSGKEMKNAETEETIALEDGRTLPVKFRIEEELVLEFTVPAVTPDGVPDSVYDAENVITDSPIMSGTFLRNILLVAFRDGATRAERQEAVDLVGGDVVGGKRVMGDDGFYFVRIEDDGTAGPLFEAIETLQALPQVVSASAEHLAPSFDLYHRSNDGSGSPSLQPSIRDGAHDGPEGFYFLPPMVDEPTVDGTFDPSRSPTVEVCLLLEAGCEPVIATFTMDTGPGSETVRVDEEAEHYVANLHTRDLKLLDGQIYRVRVLLEGREVGHADILVVNSGKELKNADTSELIPLKDGRTLPIKFRIEEELVLEFMVPALPPDSTPQEVIDEIYADSNVIDDEPFIAGEIPADIVWVTFQFDATREERQAAVDQVDGEVVGGKFMNPGGIYYIRVPTDGTPDSLFEIIEDLDSLPQVRWVGPEVNLGISPTYRRPDDGERRREDPREPDPVPAHGERTKDDIVPAVPPDTVPEGFYDEDNFRTGSACTTGRMLRGIVVVIFEEETTQPEKQQAVDAVDGEVVGGIRSRDDIEGFYYVRVEDDPDGQVLCDAVETLNDLPQVGNATPSLTMRSFYRRPDDGGD